MADIVGSKEAFLNEARAAYERIGRDLGARMLVSMGQPMFSVRHPTSNVYIIEGTLGELGNRRRKRETALVNGSIWQYEVSGLPLDTGVAICIAVARRFGDLDKVAALTLLLGLAPEFHKKKFLKEVLLL